MILYLWEGFILNIVLTKLHGLLRCTISMQTVLLDCMPLFLFVFGYSAWLSTFRVLRRHVAFRIKLMTSEPVTQAQHPLLVLLEVALPGQVVQGNCFYLAHDSLGRNEHCTQKYPRWLA